MGRPEKPVDRTVRERADLADFLRGLKAAAGMTYEQMAKETNGVLSKATFERAASGASVPAWGTVAYFLTITMTADTWLMSNREPHVHARYLWTCARRATRAPYYVHKAPDPELVWGVADFSRALRDQHVWAGYPSPREMERMAGPGGLPSTTARRIIQGHILPVDPAQAIAFLEACDTVDLVPWIEAGRRALENDRPHDTGTYAWVKAHKRMLDKFKSAAMQGDSELLSLVGRTPRPATW
ncbi:helix-turn-helix domain-containing protein [Streptomyces sp. NPDC023327]|uniref:helix-turn-helix domain-containing protein n=1 Tax=Streptomyces sp. NPDC023327 TaxID=3157088 RepID=UPI0033DDDC40